MSSQPCLGLPSALFPSERRNDLGSSVNEKEGIRKEGRHKR